jgi:transcription-repair coupling factor (superfamily II helicase)
VAAGLWRRLRRPLLIVTPNAEEAERFWEELTFYLPRHAEALYYPAWEVLPFEPLAPSTEISARRIATRDALLRAADPVVVAPYEAAVQRLTPRGTFATTRISVRPGDTIDRDAFGRRLLQLGYVPAAAVEAPGEFSRRGGVIDVFPPSEAEPVRIDLFDREVESIRRFSAETQRSADEIGSAVILPAREVILDGQALVTLKEHLPPPQEREQSDPILEALNIPGLEHYGALLAHSEQTVADYFNEPPVVVVSEFTDVESRARNFAREIHQEKERACLPGLFDPERAYTPFDRWAASLREQDTLYLDAFGLPPDGSESMRTESSSGRSFVMAGRSEEHRESPLAATMGQIKKLQNERAVFLVARTEESADRFTGICREAEIGVRALPPREAADELMTPRTGSPVVTWGGVAEGFHLPGENLLVVSEEDIFGAKFRSRERRPVTQSAFTADFRNLKEGDPVVHIEHGIGLYGGLTRMDAGGETREFLVISYAGGDRVYVPVDAMDAVQRYISSEGGAPAIDKLGGRGWEARKKKAKKALLTMARELLHLYAVRQSTPGYAFAADTPWQTEFEMSFEYEETEDQRRATEEIKADMEGPNPMDRLVCGDVGYGKTEVAMRGAFKAVMDSKQVAVVAPTTILVQQHLATFRQRFADHPVRIEMLSRFVRPVEQKKIIADTAAGKVVILIGTHRLFGRDVTFADLGLVVIDEEQRFGVKHKEALKRLRETVDVLAMTATPIPRTLYFSLSGIRELSQITTPPRDRLAVSNTVTPFNAGVIREAIMREVRRGGQVFFIHNRVASIPGMGAYLQKIVPEVRIGIAHGRMNEKQLEKVMSAFRAGEYDVLLSTTIVESGLDIPNANTMFINRADTFGLAELYQLRGRIGRSRHRAYAYFLVPVEGGLSPVARKRIEVIRDFAHLGAGFQIALYDLEIRGSGSVLGYRQSWHIATIGFELYTRLLRDTIAELRGEPAEAKAETKVTLGLSSFLPEAWIDAMDERLLVYKRLAGAGDPAEVQEIGVELRERFGPAPEPARNLLWAASLRTLPSARPLP